MIRRLLPFLSALLLVVPLTGCVARSSDRIGNVIPLDLREGATTVEHLAPDGRRGMLVLARDPVWRAPMLMAMLPRSTGAGGWDVIGMQSEQGALVPSLDGRGRALVVARAKVGGMPATLLFVAGPDAGDAAAPGQPRRMQIRTLRLDAGSDDASFRQIGIQATRRAFCSPTEAIAVTFHIALPDNDATQDGCRAAGS